MLILNVLFSIVLVLGSGRACDDIGEEEQLGLFRHQQLDDSVLAYDYSPNPWSSLNYQPRSRLPGYADLYSKGRTSVKRPELIVPPRSYLTGKNGVENRVEGRLALRDFASNFINTGVFNNRFTPANTWRPFSNLANRIPVSYNPNFDNPLDNFDACTGPSGHSGICVPGSACSLFGGRPSGSCILGKVCCINVMSSCGATVTLNNTYWQSPSTISTPSTCVLTVKVDTKFIEQKRPICQIRLDFISFTTTQPTAGTCSDTFRVGGATTVVPVICGDNSGQHMYLDVPSSDLTSSNIQLMFNFLTASSIRSWNIKIAMLPCGASYLAPGNCLQYFTAATGRVKSFNWQDTPTGTTRQLNNQNYNICFRTELVSSQRAAQICLSVCSVTNGGDPFSITTPASVRPARTGFDAISDLPIPAAALNSNVGTAVSNAAGDTLVATCLYDFIIIDGGRGVNGITADRYCGNHLNPAVGTVRLPGLTTSVQVCTPMRPFVIKYQTDGTEAAIMTANPPAVPAVARNDDLNTGFCLDYQEL
ncbi:Uncharacterized protein APZ42_020016 [Daphnia magna]|uniref:CUB domain-containing protein n=1 Tax=Daphnia magna TaxID=35525 RepID=A0A0P5YCK0_9CRUS|nr:Uncharacterized protein APZ42_020016 [Daphnia magna]